MGCQEERTLPARWFGQVPGQNEPRNCVNIAGKGRKQRCRINVESNLSEIAQKDGPVLQSRISWSTSDFQKGWSSPSCLERGDSIWQQESDSGDKFGDLRRESRRLGQGDPCTGRR